MQEPRPPVSLHPAVCLTILGSLSMFCAALAMGPFQQMPGVSDNLSCLRGQRPLSEPKLPANGDQYEPQKSSRTSGRPWAPFREGCSNHPKKPMWAKTLSFQQLSSLDRHTITYPFCTIGVGLQSGWFPPLCVSFATKYSPRPHQFSIKLT